MGSMSVSPEQAVATLQARWERDLALDAQAAADASAILPQLVERLARAGAREIYLFGSLAEGRFRRSSDIDLAVRGLDDRTLSRVSSELSAAAGRRVDLVPLDEVPTGLALRIQVLGRRLR